MRPPENLNSASEADPNAAVPSINNRAAVRTASTGLAMAAADSAAAALFWFEGLSDP